MPAFILGRAARWYGQRGYPIFPLHDVTRGHCSCGSGSCESPGKHPRISRWPQQATTAVAMIRAWWHLWPEANIALVTGEASGLVVLDVDPRHGGELALYELQDRFGEWPATVAARTGGGGWHFFFRHPGVRVPNSSGLLLGLLRTWNRQSCRPPMAEEELERTIESIADSERRRRRGR